MLRRRYSHSLNRSGSDGQFESEVDPNSSLTNVADCMLVLMLGLLVALVVHYNVDLVPQDEITGVEVNMDEDNDKAIDDNYSEAGTVYYDDRTGNYYLLKE